MTKRNDATRRALWPFTSHFNEYRIFMCLWKWGSQGIDNISREGTPHKRNDMTSPHEATKKAEKAIYSMKRDHNKPRQVS